MSGMVVAAADGSQQALFAVDWAADCARRRGVSLRIVHVREPWAHTYPFHGVAGYRESATAHCEGVLVRAAERTRERVPGLDVSTSLVSGAVVDQLQAASAGAVMIVIGSRGLGGFAGLVLGSVGLGLAARARVPVVVVRGLRPQVYGEVVVGFDGSAHSDQALEFAVEEARLRQSRLRAVQAWHPPMFSSVAVGCSPAVTEIFGAQTEKFHAQLTIWRDKHPGVSVVESAVWGHPIPALADASRAADLLVVGSRGRGEVSGALLGSVSHGVLHRAHCPVAIVP